MGTTTLTAGETSAAAAGAILGGMLTSILAVVLIFYVLLIIAMWKIFTKAGEKGWKSIIPIYNVYIYFKIAGVKNYFWILFCAIIIEYIVIAAAGQNSAVAGIVTIIYVILALVLDILHSVKLSKAFGHGGGYAVGLILLPNIFTLILGFGKDEYVGVEGK